MERNEISLTEKQKLKDNMGDPEGLQKNTQ